VVGGEEASACNKASKTIQASVLNKTQAEQRTGGRSTAFGSNYTFMDQIWQLGSVACSSAGVKHMKHSNHFPK